MEDIYIKMEQKQYYIASGLFPFNKCKLFRIIIKNVLLSTAPYDRISLHSHAMVKYKGPYRKCL